MKIRKNKSGSIRCTAQSKRDSLYLKRLLASWADDLEMVKEIDHELSILEEKQVKKVIESTKK